MTFTYIAYGVYINSEVELPMLLKADIDNHKTDITVKKGHVEFQLKESPLLSNDFTLLSATELIFHIPEVGMYYVCNGDTILVDAFSDNKEEVALYVSTVGIAAALTQKNIIPFHVSGVFVKPEEVVLFAAPSTTGKSTTVTMLQSIGYKIFTDDTCTISVQDGVAYAQASYPTVKLWQNTIDAQNHYDADMKRSILSKKDKYGFFFHEDFFPGKVKIRAIVFLEKKGDSIQVNELSAMDMLEHLYRNIYGKIWLSAAKKEVLLFEELTKISKAISGFKAVRPDSTDTFDDFAKAIEQEIILKL